MRLCPACTREFPDDPNHFNPQFAECFGCRAKGISVSFGAGGAEGKKMFHNVTNKEFNDSQIREARANGLDPVPVGKGSYYGPVGGK